MMSYEHKRRCVYLLEYHIVFATNYRKKFINDKITDFLENAAQDICLNMGGKLVSLSTAPDYVHIVAALPPDTSPGSAAAVLKTQLSRRLRKEKDLIKHIWQYLHTDLPLWSDTHFLTTAGNDLSQADINAYMENERTDPKKRKYVKSGKYGTNRW